MELAYVDGRQAHWYCLGGREGEARGQGGREHAAVVDVVVVVVVRGGGGGIVVLVIQVGHFTLVLLPSFSEG